MAVGETRTIRLEPKEAYGVHNDDHVITVSRDRLEDRSDVAAAEGELVGSENGKTGWITDVTDDTVEIDFNHELAGVPVVFEIRVLEARDEREADAHNDEWDRTERRLNDATA